MVMYIMIACSVNPIDIKCSQRCKVILSCGHRCDSKCSQCFLTRIHEPCKYENVGVRFCGHRIQVPCQDVSDRHPGRNVCTSSCAHVKCKHDCAVKCLYHVIYHAPGVVHILSAQNFAMKFVTGQCVINTVETC